MVGESKANRKNRTGKISPNHHETAVKSVNDDPCDWPNTESNGDLGEGKEWSEPL